MSQRKGLRTVHAHNAQLLEPLWSALPKCRYNLHRGKSDGMIPFDGNFTGGKFAEIFFSTGMNIVDENSTGIFSPMKKLLVKFPSMEIKPVNIPDVNCFIFQQPGPYFTPKLWSTLPKYRSYFRREKIPVEMEIICYFIKWFYILFKKWMMVWRN